MTVKSVTKTPVRLSRTPATNQRITAPNATTAKWTGGSLAYNPPPVVKIGGNKASMVKRTPSTYDNTTKKVPTVVKKLSQNQVSQLARVSIAAAVSVLPSVLLKSKPKATVSSKIVAPIRPVNKSVVPGASGSKSVGSGGSSWVGGYNVTSSESRAMTSGKTPSGAKGSITTSGGKQWTY